MLPIGKRTYGMTVSLCEIWWAQEDSNLRPSGYEPGALPTELWAPECFNLLRNYEAFYCGWDV